MANTIAFDEQFYLQQNPDVAAAVSRKLIASAADHYEQYGRFESRNPNAFFNTSFYLAQYPDVAKAGVNPLTHFLNFGVNEARATNAGELAAFDTDGNGFVNEFNATAYLAANPDVAAAGVGAYKHFIEFGQFEGRSAPLNNGTAVQGPFGNTGAGGSTFALTTGIDNLVGTSANDTFNASITPTSTGVLGALDKIDGGIGVDTLNITDTNTASTAALSLPAGFSVSNVERIAVTTNGGLTTDTSGFAGVTSFTGVAAGSANSAVKVSDTTDVNLTVAGAATAGVTGGKGVTVSAGTGAVTVTGAALTNVIVNGSAGATIDNTSSAGASATGTTLTSVTLAKVDGPSAIKGQGLTSVTVTGATANANTITVTDAKANHSIALNVNGTGYKADGTAAVTTFVDASAQTITVNSTGAKSNVSLAGSTAATTVNVTGAVDVALATGTLSTLTKIDASTATGNITLGALNAATVNVLTGSGADSFAINATAKVAVDTGAGNDIVTLTSALAAGSTVSLGAGDDVLLGTTPIAASTSSATTVIDGGAGIDSVSTNLINAGNAAQFVNFEKLSLGTGSLDASLLTKSTITGISIDGTAGATISGLTTSQGLTVTADNAAGSTSTLTFSNASGTTDSYDITFNAKTAGTTAAPTTIAANVLSIQGIETVNIHSGAASGVALNTISLADTSARSLVIDGSQALTVAFDVGGFGTAGANGVSSINGAAATGALSINLANVSAATSGLTVTGGSGADTITTSNFAATLTGGAGTDKFVLSASANTTALVDAVITDFTKGESITFVNKGTETFTSTKLDVSAAQTLEAAVTLASADNGSTNATVKWFQYGSDTYVVEHNAAAGLSSATDVVVKLTGLLDLSTASLGGTDGNVLTY